MNERLTGRKSKDEKSRTDFDYLDRVTDEEIDKEIKDDPDTLTLDDCDMTQLRVVYQKRCPKKEQGRLLLRIPGFAHIISSMTAD